MSDLKPCPFCGTSDVEIRVSITDAMVACNNCGCRTGFVYLGASEASNAAKIREVVLRWNDRTPEAADKLEAMQAALESVPIPGMIEPMPEFSKRMDEWLNTTYRDALNLNRERG